MVQELTYAAVTFVECATAQGELGSYAGHAQCMGVAFSICRFVLTITIGMG